MLVLVVWSWSNDEIGHKLGISEVTVKKHVSRLLRKFDAKNRLDLALKVIARGVVRSSEQAEDEDPGAGPPPMPER